MLAQNELNKYSVEELEKMMKAIEAKEDKDADGDK